MKHITNYIIEKIFDISEAEVGIKFTNLDSYVENMAKGLADKLFFVKELPLNKYNEWIFVDFGCADGILINALSKILPKFNIKGKLVGFDISDSMIDMAKSKFKDISTDDLEVIFTADWDDVISYLKDNDNAKKTIICNSVIHEVYSYADGQSDINLFWKRITDNNFDFICVRDMMPDKSIEYKTDKKLLKTFYDHVDNDKPNLKRYIKDFEEHWGSIEENKNFIHYLLKYRWTTNWTREVNENYFPIMIDEFLSKMNGFKRIYFKEFRVPFLEDCWKEDFGIKLKDNTHIKAIFGK